MDRETRTQPLALTPQLWTWLEHPSQWKLISSLLPAAEDVRASQERRQWSRRNQHRHPYKEILICLQGAGVYGMGDVLHGCAPGTVFFFDRDEPHDCHYPADSKPLVHLWLRFVHDEIFVHLLIADAAGIHFDEASRLLLDARACGLAGPGRSPRTRSGRGLPADCATGAGRGIPVGSASSAGRGLSAGRVTCVGRGSPAGSGTDAGAIAAPLIWPDADQAACLPAPALRARLIGLVATLSAHLLEALHTPRPTGKLFQLEVVQAVQRHLRETGGAGDSLDTLAGMAGYSKYHFARLFKEQTGVTVHRFIDACRLAKVEEYRGKGFNQTQMAAALGFAAPSAFSRWLRAREPADLSAPQDRGSADSKSTHDVSPPHG